MPWIHNSAEGMELDYERLLESIGNREARIAVLGLGHVGLPMAAIAAARGYRVTGIDIDKLIVNRVNGKSSPINEPGLEGLIREAVECGRLTASTRATGVKDSDIVLIVVQTPVDEHGQPRLESLLSACRSVARKLSRGTLVLVESTVPPGTARRRLLPVLESSGLVAGEDFFLAYSPERAMPTRTLQEIQENSRVVGGDGRSTELARAFYGNVTSGGICTGSLEEVEVVKLIENTFRDVNIALANEVALFCEALGVDSLKAIELANRHPRVNFHLPGPGVGGHCIPKDPHFLISAAEKLGIELKVIKAGRERNSSMPGHVLRKLEEALKRKGISIDGSKIAILGLAYKGNTDDMRATPAEPIIKSLMHRKAEVSSHDPYVKQDFGGAVSSKIEEAVEGADAIVVLADHDEYRELELAKLKPILKENAAIIDGRRVFSREEIQELKLSYYGIGR